MPVNIKVGGKQYVPSTREETRVPTTHVSFAAYDNMCGMATARDWAVKMWEEAAALNQEVSDRDESHAGYAGAVKYLESLYGSITNECSLYLAAERRADLCWQELLSNEREELLLDEMFMVPVDRPNLYGLWQSPLPLSPGAPKEFPMDEIALLIAVTPQREVYERMRNDKG